MPTGFIDAHRKITSIGVCITKLPVHNRINIFEAYPLSIFVLETNLTVMHCSCTAHIAATHIYRILILLISFASQISSPYLLLAPPPLPLHVKYYGGFMYNRCIGTGWPSDYSIYLLAGRLGFKSWLGGHTKTYKRYLLPCCLVHSETGTGTIVHVKI